MAASDDARQLHTACFELARATKWARKPIDTAEFDELAKKLSAIAAERVCEGLDINLPLITRAVRYIAQAHGMPMMGDDTQWFENMLTALLEVARPNSGLDESGRAFLYDMADGIEATLDGR
jgi:hypothetical protein